MNTASILFGSVGLSTNRIIKTTVNVECLFGLAREAAERAGDAIRMNHADSIHILGRALVWRKEKCYTPFSSGRRVLKKVRK